MDEEIDEEMDEEKDEKKDEKKEAHSRKWPEGGKKVERM